MRRGGARPWSGSAVAALLALVIAAGLLSPSPGPPASRAAHNPGAPLSGLLWVTTDLDPRLSTFSMTPTDRTTAEITFSQIGALPGAIPYAGCDPGPGPGPVFYVGTYQTAAGDSGTIAGCQGSAQSSFSGWYRSSTQTTPNQAWGITLQIGGPSAGPGTYALPGELLPERRLSWQEAPAGTPPPPPLPSSPISPGPGEGCVGTAVPGEMQTAPPKTFCGSKPMANDLRTNIEAAAISTGGAAFTTCLAYVLAATAAGATVPFSGGTTITIAPWILQAAAGTCGATVLTWAGFRLTTLKDDIVRSKTGTPAFDQEIGARTAATPPPAVRVALPRPRLARGAGLSRGCRGAGRAGCVRLAGLAGRAVSASAEVASLAEAMAVSGDRSLRAATAGDAQAAAAQDAVANAYAGALADALVAQRLALRALARGLRTSGIDIRPPRARVAGLRQRLARLKGVPPAVVSRLRRDGFSEAQLREAFRALGEVPARPLSLTAALTLPTPTAGLAGAPESIDIPQATAVVRVLNAQGALPGPLAATLLADLERLRVAGASARDAAADRLAADARRARGRHGIVLRLVITPLVALEGG